MLWDASAVNDVRFVVHIKGIIVLMFYVGQKGLFVAEGSFFTFRTIQSVKSCISLSEAKGISLEISNYLLSGGGWSSYW